MPVPVDGAACLAGRHRCAARQPLSRPARRSRRVGQAHQGQQHQLRGKYRKVYALLKNDSKLRSKIKQAAAAYGIDPMHIVGADRRRAHLQCRCLRPASDLLRQGGLLSQQQTDIQLRRRGHHRLRGASRIRRVRGRGRQLRTVDLPGNGVEHILSRQAGRRHELPQRPLQRHFLPAASMPARPSASASSTR